MGNMLWTVQARDLFRYYANTCTFGYSFVWWQWKDWERWEIKFILKIMAKDSVRYKKVLHRQIIMTRILPGTSTGWPWMESTYHWPRAGRRRFGGGFGRSLDSKRLNFVWNFICFYPLQFCIGGDISAFCRTRFSPLGQNGEPPRMGRSPAKVNSDRDRMVLTTNLVTLKLVLTTNGPLSVGLSGAGTSCKLSFNTRSLRGWEA